MQTTVDDMNRLRVQAERELAECKEKLSARDQRITELNAEVIRLESMRRTTQAALDVKEKECERLRESRDHWDDYSARANLQIEKLEQSIDQTETERDTALAMVEQCTARLNEASAQLATSTEALSTALAELATARKDLLNLEWRDLERRESLREERDEALAEAERLRGELAKAREEIELRNALQADGLFP